ncbi:MAG TPA: DUF6499 domain-containing protein [Microvirga sp.]|jgi:hypothetical protein|nr:DUF6499 domain-containing protein [Microvirga sp.]
MSSRDWRSGAAYDDLDELSLRGLAWEYLRRNPNYIADYDQVASDPTDPSRVGEVAKSWGLRFRGRSIPSGYGRTGVLGISFDIDSNVSSPTGEAIRDVRRASFLAVGMG